MTGKDLAYIAATFAVGFVAFKIYSTAKKAVDSGLSAGASIVDAAKEVVTKDLNPTSTENVIYKGVSAAVTAVTGGKQDIPLGTRIYDWLHPDENINSAVVDNSPKAQAQTDFRQDEITAQNLVAESQKKADEEMSRKKSYFRLRELELDKPMKFPTPDEIFYSQQLGL